SAGLRVSGLFDGRLCADWREGCGNVFENVVGEWFGEGVYELDGVFEMKVAQVGFWMFWVIMI
uniref:hypothetical protein n=1 Tax=Bacillus subtilis TaxID=1423 RepID=UPI001BDBAA33